MDFLSMKRTSLRVDAAQALGNTEFWRQSIGVGGVSYEPLPCRVSSALKALKPRLVRIFLQEYFNIYPDHGAFDWSRLDPYMDAIERTGAKVLATINIKPPVLFSGVDDNNWWPNNVEEYQDVIRALVRRYSVERNIVTHWEHLNETDFGEVGGCPFQIPGAEENHAFYQMLVKPVLEVFPEAKVGGPAIGNFNNPMLQGFVSLCRANQTSLHFVSWHSYHNDCMSLARQTEAMRRVLDSYNSNERPEMMINEMNKGFDFQDASNPSLHLVSVEEQAYQSNRAAFLASAIIAMNDAGLDWSHYYHAWDCGMQPGEFARFFSDSGVREVMYRHWNETPHRFGLFSDSGRPRPQYFVYRLFGLLEGERLLCTADNGELSTTAAKGKGHVAVIISNYANSHADDRIAQIHFSGLAPGRKVLTVYRIDNSCRWNEDTLELLPVETRRVEVMAEFTCQCFCPENSVTAVLLEDAGGPENVD
jgi:xylan 1,4-beta-xylosidase